MMCERAGEVTAQTRSKSLQLGAIFCAYTKVRRYLLYLSKQLYNPQQLKSLVNSPPKLGPPFEIHEDGLPRVSSSFQIGLTVAYWSHYYQH